MDKTYARFVVTVSASVEDINAMSESVENLTRALVEDIDDKCTVYNGSTIRVKFNELQEYDYSQPAEQMRAAVTDRIPAQCFHPGEYIRDEMEARKWNVAELAKRMSSADMPVEIVAALIDCKLDITPSIAFGLRRAFGTSADLWMNLQKSFEVWRESRPTLLAVDGAKVCVKCGANVDGLIYCKRCGTDTPRR